MDTRNQSYLLPTMRSKFDSLTNDGTFVVWLYATVSVIIISLCGLVLIVCMPKFQKTRTDLLQFLIGLAIGTLTADALLHLLPFSSHRHSHGIEDINSKNSSVRHHDDDDHHHAGHALDYGFWLRFMALIGIIGFLVLERITFILTDVCTKRSVSHSCDSTYDNSNEVDKTNPTSRKNLAPTESHAHQNHHQHQHHHLDSETRSFMFMIITGDGVHNFFDGVAIGASYGASLTVGLSTSIAILCHELPHEIGDFAVLIKSGMTIKRAIIYNTLSSILCLMGAIFGVFIGKIDIGPISAWIAGSFLYISLVDMVPQLDCYPTRPASERALKLLIQTSGILLGVAIMSLIALYEHEFEKLISGFNH